MSLLEKLFPKEETPALNWKNLSTEAGLADLIHRSYTVPCGIFKHSTRCSVSDMVKNRLEKRWQFAPDALEMYYLDLIRYRAVSNRIAEFFEVKHESPQFIVIKDGKVAYHNSHTAIDAEEVAEALGEGKL
ncbi:bacillithiol system redox-active protein YtxJ [Sphingobacteriales bacterium UPWRP_1]|nr:hypothetical protein B6N25_05100 [Sphingobacteriales bacterium TSM_CSS]PSJ77676.1 bacillithiol system redox-active protein YtxJ [Sphingobacteriales bacterium UPWRP_1]